MQAHDSDSPAGRSCPDCSQRLEPLELTEPVAFPIERCGACEGLFFRPGALNLLLESQLAATTGLDPKLMVDCPSKSQQEEQVFYRKCPVCADIMNRYNFGGRSGVIVDYCAQHGLWLDKGELRQLVTWWQTGGKAIYEHHQVEKMQRLAPRRPLLFPDGSIVSVPRPEEPAWYWHAAVIATEILLSLIG
jgi:Zn-finger nucleic acid-binding protein